MPSTWAAWKSKFERRRGQEAPPKPILPTSTSTSKTPSDPSSFRHETSPRSLQARIWNQAYDELKVNESKVVGTYEKLLTAELRRDISTSTNASSQGNEIEQAPEGRWRQMEQLVQAGLERIQMAVDIKEGIERGMQAAYTVKETVGKAVQASPEAALAWVGVCFALEVRSSFSPYLTWEDPLTSHPIDTIESNHSTRHKPPRNGLCCVKNGLVLELSGPPSRREPG